jgi:uncharacterized lipoprotein YajG
MRRVFVLAIFLLFDGCGTVPLEPVPVRLALNVPVVSVNVGGGAKVFMQVLDERPEKNADPQGKYDHDAVAPILPVDDPSPALQDLFAKRLSALGFDVLNIPDPLSTRLDIVLQKLEYGRYSTTGPCFHIDASMTGSVYKANARVIDKNYLRTYGDISQSTTRDRNWVEAKTNKVLAQLVEKLLSDLELLAALK